MTQRSRRVFEILGGVILPLVCFIFDPIVFRSGFFGGPFLGALAPFAYAAAAVAMITFSYSLSVERSSDLRAGLLFAAAIVSAAIGLMILPFAVFGIFMRGLGLLGLVPFLTAFVYLRGARRTRVRFRNRYALAGMFLFLVVPATIQYGVDHIVAVAVHALPQPAAMRVLAAVRPVLGLDDLVWSYNSEHDAAKKRVMASAYHELTAATSNLG